MKKTWPILALASLTVAALAARHYQSGQQARTARTSLAPSLPAASPPAAPAVSPPTQEQRVQAAAIAIADYYRGSRQIDKARRAMEEMEDFDSAQLQQLARSLNTARDFDDSPRCAALALSISYLARKDPDAALSLLRDLSRRNEGLIPAGDLAAQTLSLLLDSQPRLAAAWLPDCAAMLTPRQREGITTHTLVRISRFDPAAAFDLFQPLSVADPAATGRSIARAAGTPAAKTALLAALRRHLLNHPPGVEASDTLRQTVMEEFGRQLEEQPFEVAIAWIDSAALDEEETGFLAGAINRPTLTDDTGKWIDWLCRQLPAGEMEYRLQDMITIWSDTDVLGVERWIRQISQNEVKEAASLSYAHAAARRSPDSALRIAMTLPPGEKRDQALALIRQVSEELGSDQ